REACCRQLLTRIGSLLVYSSVKDEPHRFFFFQAEDGIRDWSVTGVQTCALPISKPRLVVASSTVNPRPPISASAGMTGRRCSSRSGERRVGEEGGLRGERDD